MLVYWLLFAFAAAMAMASPVRSHAAFGPGQALAMLGFVLFYFLVAALRYETGGDWETYQEMYDNAAVGGLLAAMNSTDPVFGAILWFSSGLDLGQYAANAVCAALLCYGVLRTSASTRDPWLGIVASVPYLLIVVGMGYVRQAGAIGLILIAVNAVGRGQRSWAIVCLVLAAGFHSTAAILFPIFGYALSGRNKPIALVLAVLGGAGLIFVLGSRYTEFEAGYIEAEYSSGGALVRVLMNIVPAVLFLARRRSLGLSEQSQTLWTLIALSSLLAAAALVVSPSSTAVDRIGLYFSIIQVFGFGNLRVLVPFSERSAFLLRSLVVGLAAAIQSVWLVFATHAEFWVPYESVLQFL